MRGYLCKDLEEQCCIFTFTWSILSSLYFFFFFSKRRLLKAFLAKSRECPTCWRVTNIKLNPDLNVSLKVSHAVWEKGGRGPGFLKFSLRNIVLCKSHCQLLRCNSMFFWSPKFLEVNKLGEVLTWHLNKRKHISRTLFSLFQVFHCWLPLYLMDFLMVFCPWIPRRR